MTQLSSQDCARILLATTGGWEAADGTAGVVENARGALAGVIRASGGRGFPAPAVLPAGGLSPRSWPSCVAAAQAATNGEPGPGAPANVVFWKPDPDDPMKPAEDLKSSLRWPFAAGSVLGNVSGALRDSDGAIKRLYFFTAIDPSALAVDFDEGPGWWPRAGHRIVKTEAEPERAVEQAPDKPDLPAHVRPQAAAVLLVVSLVLFAMAASGVFSLAHPPEPGKWYDWCGWMKTDAKKNDNLVPAFLLVMASLTALVLGAGLGLKGRWFGALIDERNRVSLTRLQQLAWGILLFSALAVTAWFNAGIIPWLATPVPGKALDELFPQVDAALWAAAGITLAVTPFLSGQILAVKQQGADSAQDAGPAAPARAAPAGMITPADLDRNETPADAGWVDLITGETTGKDETIDVSRLQQLIISGLLLSGYLIALVDQLSGIAAKTVIAALPHVDTQGTFIELLAFSNGTYLGFKARAQSQSQPAPAKN